MTTEQKHEIEIPGLPEGYKAVAYRIGEIDECCLDPKTGEILKLFLATDVPVLIVEKIRPRRIVLEETGECLHEFKGNGWVLISAAALKCVHGIECFPDYKIFREVKE